MVSQFLLKSVLGVACLLPIAFVMRDDIYDFCLSPLVFVAPVSVDAVTDFTYRADHTNLWLAVIDDHQAPIQQTQTESSGTESILSTNSPESNLESFAVAFPELGDVLTASTRRRKIRTESEKLLYELENLTPESDIEANESNVPLPNDFVFLEVLTKQRGLVEAERQLRAARLSKPDNIVQLRQQVESVRKLMKELNLDQVAAHTEFLQLEEAEIQGYQLRYIDAFKTESIFTLLAERGFQVLTDRAIEDACQQLLARVDKLKAYSATYALNGSHAKWVTQERVLCEQLHNFLERMRDLDESQFDKRIRLLAELRDSEVVPESVRVLLLTGTYQICDNYLTRILPLDDFVLSMDGLGPTAKALSVHRSDITLVWDDKRLERLIDSQQNEISIPATRLRRVIVAGKGTRPAILRGTQKSEASAAYNRLRSRVDWTVSTLQSLQQGCLVHSAHLGTVWTRIEEINMLAAEFPQLFVGVPVR